MGNWKKLLNRSGIISTAATVALCGMVFNVASAATILQTSFDYQTTGAAPSGWTKNSSSNTSVTVDAFPSATNKSMKLYDNTTGSSATVYRSFTTQSTGSTFEFKFYTTNTTAGANFAVRSGSTKAVDLYVGNTGQELYYMNGSTKVVLESNLANNTWYSMKVFADPATDKMNVYLNGVQKASNAPFKTTVTSLNSIYFGTTNNTIQSLYIDDINFYEGSTAPVQLPGTIVNASIVIPAGTTFDGQGARYIAGEGLGDGSQAEGQLPVFYLEKGANLKNVILGSPAADGVHCYGDNIVENVVWEDIGEDALTVKDSGTVTVIGGSAKDGSDKVFQINAASTFKVIGFKADNANKLIRQNGGTTFKVDVIIDQSDFSNMDECLFRTDSSISTVTMTNTRYHNVPDLFIGVSASNITTSNNIEY